MHLDYFSILLVCHERRWVKNSWTTLTGWTSSSVADQNFPSPALKYQGLKLGIILCLHVNFDLQPFSKDKI